MEIPLRKRVDDESGRDGKTRMSNLSELIVAGAARRIIATAQGNEIYIQ
ncbi:hypothetical protein LJ656_12715 [Paraburkholderia sp. MMS20-SJTR3]|uniref:Uncharacterized protein n=1 Tax=Paraburkholderia sejongensis TaxID=2886946 RepID=A0ABS8JU76_9BURK|nr:hypothetical protein [Paraburkholderia sp. MMS20-SJTR3]MCC8393455.1 hypothetical protein [Paraburkholderia sp. MMS20-SJTR3]